MKEWLASFKTHWLSSVSGVLGAALGSFAVAENLDKLSAGQAILAFGGCLWVAFNGAIAADANKVPPTPPPQ